MNKKKSSLTLVDIMVFLFILGAGIGIVLGFVFIGLSLFLSSMIIIALAEYKNLEYSRFMKRKNFGIIFLKVIRFLSAIGLVIALLLVITCIFNNAVRINHPSLLKKSFFTALILLWPFVFSNELIPILKIGIEKKQEEVSSL